jgi:predicted nucleotidyltransferase
MNPVEEHKIKIRALCESYQVEKLYLFGSVLKSHFDSEKSDIDFLVTFLPMPVEDYFDNFLAFFENLETVLRSKIDVIEYEAIRNPIFKRAVDREKRLFYDREAA